MSGAATRPLPVVWSIAGSDSGAGAGLQADLRALDTFGVHACTAVAALTAQNSVAVDRVDPVPTEWLDAQLAALARDLPPAAIKTGLLGSVENVRCVAAWVDRLRRRRRVALVIDPVWRASTGDELGSAALRQALVDELLPRATAITPNRAEAAWLLGGGTLDSHESVEAASRCLRAFGPTAVLITGGDASGARSLDWIDTPEARGWLAAPRIDTRHHHGSGCVFASSLAAALALDFCAADAAVLAKMSSTEAVRHGSGAGAGAGAVRPRRGFALVGGSVPVLFDRPTGGTAPFAPLADRRLGLYPIVDSADWVERVLAAGARTVQLRIKSAGTGRLAHEIRRSVASANAVGAQLFVNDHWRLAIDHGAYGVHLGQEDLDGADLTALQAAGLRLGVSTHSLWEVSRARAILPSYIACGPIHATTTKAMPWRPQGAGNLAYWCRALQEPVVAIAGMDVERSQEASRCGAAGVAVLRGIAEAADPRAAVGALMSAIDTGREAPPLAAPELPRTTLIALG